jgi:hypothetical protein
LFARKQNAPSLRVSKVFDWYAELMQQNKAQKKKGAFCESVGGIFSGLPLTESKDAGVLPGMFAQRLIHAGIE